RDRPLVLKRFVDGAEGEPFYQKRAPARRPDWLRTVTLSFPSGRTADEVVIDDAASLAWVVNLGCIELHPHPVRRERLEQDRARHRNPGQAISIRERYPRRRIPGCPPPATGPSLPAHPRGPAAIFLGCAGRPSDGHPTEPGCLLRPMDWDRLT